MAAPLPPQVWRSSVNVPGADGAEVWTVELSIDVAELVRVLGRKAAKSKGRASKGFHGLVRAKVAPL